MNTHTPISRDGCSLSAPVCSTSFSSIEKLSLAIAILVDARERARLASEALGAVFLEVTETERDLLSALGADEFKPHGIHRAALPRRTSDDLSGWIDILSHEVVSLFLSNV